MSATLQRTIKAIVVGIICAPILYCLWWLVYLIVFVLLGGVVYGFDFNHAAPDPMHVLKYAVAFWLITALALAAEAHIVVRVFLGRSVLPHRGAFRRSDGRHNKV